jgi:hypothetical protein
MMAEKVMAEVIFFTICNYQIAQCNLLDCTQVIFFLDLLMMAERQKITQLSLLKVVLLHSGMMAEKVMAEVIFFTICNYEIAQCNLLDCTQVIFFLDLLMMAERQKITQLSHKVHCMLNTLVLLHSGMSVG